MNKIKPAFTEKNIPILFASNDVFSPYAAVMIQSVIDHASLENNYDIIIFHGAISDNKQQMIQSLSQHRTNISIRFVNVDPIFDSLDLYTDIQNMRLTKETYYRLAAGQVLSNEYTKIIYLDGDMITLVDIAELYDIELGNCYLAAPYDITGIGYCCKPGNNRVHYRKNVLGLTDINSYFIAGLLVLNLSLLRQDYPGDSLLKIAASREWRQHDQDVLNVICNNKKAILLHPQWNVLPDFGNNRYLPQHLKKMWLESELKPFIIHYGGAKKPWKQNVIREEYFWE
ncbi:MAG: glycosyltransferase family 8 protein, partial [Clostridia bacterium]|nr:glycosyltransferase family 8 protein [Clostridia bacterium]